MVSQYDLMVLENCFKIINKGFTLELRIISVLNLCKKFTFCTETSKIFQLIDHTNAGLKCKTN